MVENIDATIVPKTKAINLYISDGKDYAASLDIREDR